MPEPNRKKRFCLVLIKPSHYDDDGYVIQWFRSAIPSNSLAVLYGLALECAERKALGSDVKLEIHAFDETNTRIRTRRIASLIEEAGAGVVMLVGVQSNQFPRALDIAGRATLARGPARLMSPKSTPYAAKYCPAAAGPAARSPTALPPVPATW